MHGSDYFIESGKFHVDIDSKRAQKTNAPYLVTTLSPVVVTCFWSELEIPLHARSTCIRTFFMDHESPILETWENSNLDLQKTTTPKTPVHAAIIRLMKLITRTITLGLSQNHPPDPTKSTFTKTAISLIQSETKRRLFERGRVFDCGIGMETRQINYGGCEYSIYLAQLSFQDQACNTTRLGGFAPVRSYSPNRLIRLS